MQAIRNALWGEPEYQPIPNLDDDENQYVGSPDLKHLEQPQYQPTLATTQYTTEANTTCYQDCNTAMTLDRRERLVGFFVLFCLGWFLSISTLANYTNFYSHTLSFAMWYTIGNCLALGSNFFLYGPAHQLALMFSSNHRIWTIFYLVAIGSTVLTVAMAPEWIKILMGAVLLQIIASFCFTLSFIIRGVFGRALWWLFGHLGDSEDGNSSS